jgi:hypothetical protein
MREPQATSPLGARIVAARDYAVRATMLRIIWHGALRLTAALALVGAFAPTILHAQIRGRASSTDYGWWITGGLSGVVVTDVTDGPSQSRWKFGTDPLWQYRGSLEKALDEFTTFGVTGGYGKVNLTMSSIAAGANAKLPSACQVSCAAQSEMWTGMAQFHTGGGEGFHTLFEGSAGAMSWRKFTTRADGMAIPGIKSTFDLTGTLGPGFGYALSRSVVVSLVQDFGIGFHTKTDLPEGTSRTWRVRNTRAALRLKFGGR